MTEEDKAMAVLAVLDPEHYVTCQSCGAVLEARADGMALVRCSACSIGPLFIYDPLATFDELSYDVIARSWE